MPRGGYRAGAGRKRKAGPQAASYESAQPTMTRPSVWIASIDAKKEASQWDRITLLKAGRWAVNNSGIASRLVRGTARFALGNGLVPQAQTLNPDFNRAAEQYFEDRYCNVPWAFDRSGQVNFYEAQLAIAESMMVDGDVFAQLVRSENDLPMIRLFDGSHVQSGMEASDSLVDGVKLDREGKPMSYRVMADPNDYKNFIDVPAEDLIHIRRLHRLGYVRGISWLGSGIDKIQDVREMISNELACAKLNSKVGLIIESEEAGTLGLGSMLATDTDGLGNTQQIEKIFQGVGTVQLKKGEKLQAHTFDRPGNGLLVFDEHQTREIAYGFGVSPEVIWNMKGLGGTATRSALQDADVFFGSIRLMIEQQFCVRVWRYAIWHAIRTGKLTDPGDDWFRVSFVGPARLSVDFGRDSRAMLELVRAGLLSRRKYHNMIGEDSESQMEDIIREAAKRKKMVQRIAQEEGVDLTLEEIFPPAPGAAAPAQANQENDNTNRGNSNENE